MGMEELQYFSVHTISERWGCSETKVSRILEKFRGRTGFPDLGAPENVRLHKRRHAIVRIHPSLLKEIEGKL